jgi:hypothetical protein
MNLFRPPLRRAGRPRGTPRRLSEAFDRLGQLALEGLAAHLAVGDDREARFFLGFHSFVYRIVLDSLELRRGDVACGVAVAGVLQLRRAEQAPHDVDPGGHGLQVLLPAIRR